MKYLIPLCFIILILLSCQRNIQNDTITISVKSERDSLEIGFCSISLFIKDFPVKDTFADLEGEFTFNKKKIDGVIISGAGHYPVYKSMNELEIDSVVFLKTSKILINTGGMGIDTVLIRINDSLELKKDIWNKIGK